jgi:hypothetical protein
MSFGEKEGRFGSCCVQVAILNVPTLIGLRMDVELLRTLCHRQQLAIPTREPIVQTLYIPLDRNAHFPPSMTHKKENLQNQPHLTTVPLTLLVETYI